MKKAVVFYSLSGNTQAAAKEIAEGIGADLIELKLVKPFPTEKSKQLALGGMQAMFGMKPAIQELSKNIKEYDVLILGTPIWGVRLLLQYIVFLTSIKFWIRLLPFLLLVVAVTTSDVSQNCRSVYRV